MFTTLLLFTFAAPEPPAITAERAANAVIIRRGESLVSEYRHGGTMPNDKGDADKPLAKPFFFPLNAPNGLGVTRAWPMERGTAGETRDHYHQKSAWFCHGDVIPHGLTLKTRSKDKNVAGVDFWSELDGHGRIVCTRVTDPTADGGGVRFETVNEWRSADGDVVLTERRDFRVRALPHGTLIAMQSRLAASEHDITFADTKESAFGLRVRDEFRLTARGSAGAIATADGLRAAAPAKDNLPFWGQMADWHDYSGEAEGKAAGAAIFAHPANAHPSAWHSRAYGLMAANPFARARSGFPALAGRTDAVRLNKGESLTLIFALYVHNGDAAAGDVAGAYRIFTDMMK